KSSTRAQNIQEAAEKPSTSVKGTNSLKMSSQDINIAEQTVCEKDKRKSNIRRKQEAETEIATAVTDEIIMLKNLLEYSKAVDDQNSKFVLTPKNLAMTSSEMEKVNNTEKETVPIQITSMDIDGTEPSQYTDPEMIEEIDNMVDLTSEFMKGKEENIVELEKEVRTYSQVTRGKVS
ncbi:24540_t:CDS:1, partial [Gigaspora rosea]